MKTLLWESRYTLIVNGLAGLGRAFAEVGAVIIVGGNIAELTRVMTTAIVLETSKGNFVLAMSLGLTLIFISLILNFSVYFIKKTDELD
jgi:tungstate transport system permease protein